MSESQTPAQDQRCQSGPSARDSVVPSEGGFSKNYGADQQQLQISDPHCDKISTSATFAWWKIRFKTEVCTCSQFPTEAMHWIKEVDSVDDLKSSCSVRGIRMPDFEVLNAKIASALNRIIHNTQFKRKVSLEEQKSQKEDRFLRGRRIAYLIYEYFRVTGANDDFMSSSSLRGIQMPNFEVLDARIASALNRIIHNWHFKRRISLEEPEAQKQDRFLRGRQSTSGSLEPTILPRIMPTYLQLFFEMMIFRNSIRNGTEFFYQ